jgi:hypothetical protein
VSHVRRVQRRHHSGFERNREGEAVANYGNFHKTNEQFSLGDHAGRSAYYASVNANRTDLGLETPVPEALARSRHRRRGLRLIPL